MVTQEKINVWYGNTLKSERNEGWFITIFILMVTILVIILANVSWKFKFVFGLIMVAIAGIGMWKIMGANKDLEEYEEFEKSKK